MVAPATVSDLVVAEWTGLDLHALHLLHPADFGAPRHFRWDANHYHYTAAGLQVLQVALREAGQGAAAARLEALGARLGVIADLGGRDAWFKQGQYA